MKYTDTSMLVQYYGHVSLRLISVSLEERTPGMKHLGGCTGDYPAFIFPLHGKARMCFDGTWYELEQGAIVHSGPGMTLDREVVGEREWSYLLVVYEAENKEDTSLPLFSRQHFQLHLVEQSARLYKNLKLLEGYWNSPGNYYTLRLKELWYGIMDELFTLVRLSSDDAGRRVLEQVLDDIHQHYAECISMPELSRRNGMNTNRLAYLFRKHMGISPGEYINRYRINQAKNLLKSPYKLFTIKEAGIKCGFNDPLYFSKRFKKYTGESPQSYQKRFMNNPY